VRARGHRQRDQRIDDGDRDRDAQGPQRDRAVDRLADQVGEVGQ
jgi:hypothetical protein